MEHGSYKLYFLVIDCSLSTLILYFLPFLIIFPFIPSFHPPFLRSLFLLSSHSTFPSFSYILSFPPHFTPVLLPFLSFPFLSFPFPSTFIQTLYGGKTVRPNSLTESRRVSSGSSSSSCFDKEDRKLPSLEISNKIS